MRVLEPPEHYHQELLDLRRVNKYANRWKAKLEVRTNRDSTLYP